MAVKRAKKTLAPPYRVWVIVDALSGHALWVSEEPDKLELLDNEAVYQYTLSQTTPPRGSHGK